MLACANPPTACLATVYRHLRTPAATRPWCAAAICPAAKPCRSHPNGMSNHLTCVDCAARWCCKSCPMHEAH